MKTLLVMRHAKSDWGASFSDDHERPLARRGVKASRRMGSYLRAVGVTPQLVISSTAVRARTTAELAAEAGQWGCEIILNGNLYASDPERILEIVNGTKNGVERLLIAGHEPTSSMLITWLIGGGQVRMPTAAVACLDLVHGEWSDLAPATCELRWLMTPKMLKKK